MTEALLLLPSPCLIQFLSKSPRFFLLLLLPTLWASLCCCSCSEIEGIWQTVTTAGRTKKEKHCTITFQNRKPKYSKSAADICTRRGWPLNHLNQNNKVSHVGVWLRKTGIKMQNSMIYLEMCDSGTHTHTHTLLKSKTYPWGFASNPIKPQSVLESIRKTECMLQVMKAAVLFTVWFYS